MGPPPLANPQEEQEFFQFPCARKGHELAQRQNELSGFSQLILCPMCNKRIPTTPWCLSTFLCVACSELPLQEARVRRRRFGLAARLFVQMIGPLWGEPVSLALGVHCHRTSGLVSQPPSGDLVEALGIIIGSQRCLFWGMFAPVPSTSEKKVIWAG